MKTHILSNLSLQPIVQQLKKLVSAEHVISFEYVEDIISYLYFKKKELNEFDLLIVHTDFYFEQDADKLDSLYKALNTLAQEKVNLKIAIPSQIEFYQFNSIAENTGLNAMFTNLYYTNNLNERSNVTVYDFQRYFMEIGFNQTYHFELGHLYQLPYKKLAISSLAKSLKETIDSTFLSEKKCIILDCDNTLWGGVVGEEGIDGIKIGLYPEGMFYYQFQKFIVHKKTQGFVLCLATKNNLNDIKEVFTKKSMPLQLEDFVIIKANWDDKQISIQAIANELNIGLDSLIFIDDSNFELEFVKSSLPQVTCIKIEENWTVLNSLSNDNSFKKRNIVIEDQEKTKLYQQNLKRQEFQNQLSDRNEYIASLELKPEFKINDIDNLERLSQLTGKTNQFNFNKVEFSVAQLQQWISKGNLIISCSLTDKFGDYGIIGLMLVEQIHSKFVLENFLMSCRALGRGVEDTFWNYLTSLSINENKLIGEVKFSDTAKNAPAKDFYNKVLSNGTNR